MANGPSIIRVQCQPLTPIWTGGPDQRGDKVRETGLIGSLRWWYEAILRGIGFYACDPSAGTCVYHKEAGLKSICLTCQLFGCTGYARRFRVEVECSDNPGELLAIQLRNPGTRDHRGWRIPSKLKLPFSLSIIPLFPDSFKEPHLSSLVYTLRLIERYGAFGAKISQGQGVVQFNGAPAGMSFAEWKSLMEKRAHKAVSQPPDSPSLSDFLGLTLDLTPQGGDWWKKIPLQGLQPYCASGDLKWVPAGPAVRAMLRTELRKPSASPSDRHRLMGTIQRWGDPRPERKDGKAKDRTKGSDIFVTHLYRHNDRWRLRIFGFASAGRNPADQRMRQLLRDKDFGKPLAESLGLNEQSIVSLEPYPSEPAALLRQLEEQS